MAGYATITAPDAPLVEYDTRTCGHCQRVVFVKPGSGGTVYLLPRVGGGWREEMGCGCRVCMKPVCLQCHHIGTCTPWERRLDASERRDRLRRQIDGLLH